MEPVPQSVRLVCRAFWLMRLRWFAIAGVVVAVFFANRFLNIPLAVVPLYSIALMLVIYNLIVYVLLAHYTSCHHENSSRKIKQVINFQMSADLIFLTLLLHFSGGIENPFVIYFIFHMILASILLSPLESYLQATLGTALLLLMTQLEYSGVIDHYYLAGFFPVDVHTEGFYLFCKVGILSSAFYLVVLMTSSVSVRQRNHEEGYRLANIQLEEKDRVKDEYVARVTHDIKGHLAAIQSCLGVVGNGIAGPLNEKQEEFVGRAIGRTKKLNNFVRSLLKLTELRLTRKIDIHPYDFVEILEKAFAAIEIRASEKSIVLSKECQEGLDHILGVGVSIEELITNLLLNAIKYTPHGGRVYIDVKDAGDFVEVVISDTGIGIPADEIAYVFDEFFRATNARETEKDGTGLGLAIAKQIIERHGGQISVTSAPWEGSKFTFTLAKDPTQNKSSN